MLIWRSQFEFQLKREDSIIKLCKTLNNLWIASVHPNFKEHIQEIDDMIEMINQRIYDIIVNNK